MITDKQKKGLLATARKVVEATIRGQDISRFESEDPLFSEKRGCFVTLHNNEQLRGCIGQFMPDRSLLDTIVDMACASTRDSRFLINPVTVVELGYLDIEISVLSPLEKTDDPLSLELGRHGVYVSNGRSSGCFLPQVATETGWSKEEFLGQCCAGKAGMTADGWKYPDTQVYLFTADVFGEKDFAAL